MELAAVCDTNPKVIDRYREQFGDGLRATDDWRELLEWDDLDGVFVTTPDYLHEAPAIAALQRGKSVFLEKPMAITIDGCDAILRAARDGGARLFVGHNMRFFPVILKMKEWIDEGRIGEVQAIWCRHFVDYGGDAYFKDWHSERRFTTGLLLQKGAHDIDIIHYLAGSHTVRTVGMGKLGVYGRVTDRRDPDTSVVKQFNLNHWPPMAQTKLSPVIDVEDHSMMLMQLANSVQASYCQCHFSPDGWRNYTIIGTEGRIENQGDHSSPAHHATVHLWDRRTGVGAPQGTHIEAVPPVTGGHGGADPQMIDAFIDFVRTGQHRGATPLDARQAVAAACCATASLRNGAHAIDVPPVPDGLVD